jgi:hypothetical protein
MLETRRAPLYLLVPAFLLSALAWAALRSASAHGPGRSVALQEQVAPAASVSPSSPGPLPPVDLPPASDHDPTLLSLPDLVQTDPELGLVGGGNAFCGPVAVSDWLVHLGQNGFPKLLPTGGTLRAQQLELVRLLASPRYMGTSPLGGTGPSHLMVGVERFIKHAGYSIQRLEYQGWRGHPARYATGQRWPDLAWIQRAIAQGGAAWIHAGWYANSRYDRILRRHGGHWLAVVDVGSGGTHNPDREQLMVRDPAPYAGIEPSYEAISAERLEGGWLIDQGVAVPARGYYRLGGGMHIKREGELAVLDGAVALVLER